MRTARSSSGLQGIQSACGASQFAGGALHAIYTVMMGRVYGALLVAVLVVW